MVNYRLSAAAQSDLRRIYEYGLVQFGEAKADEYYNALFDRFDQIALMPLMFPLDNDLRRGIRKSICGIDTIYYRLSDNQVDVVRVLGRQDKFGHF